VINWTIVLSSLFASSALFAALAWLARALVTHFLSKDVERFKSQLQLATLEHQIRFSRLHEKQAAVVAEIYEKLLPAKFCFAALKKSDSEEFSPRDRKMAEKVLEICVDAFRFSHQHALYLDDAFLQKISSANIKLLQHVGLYTCLDDMLSSLGDFPHDRHHLVASTLISGWRGMEDNITPLLEELRHEFQTLLGVTTELA